MLLFQSISKEDENTTAHCRLSMLPTITDQCKIITEPHGYQRCPELHSSCNAVQETMAPHKMSPRIGSAITNNKPKL